MVMIRISSIKPGQVVASDVNDRSGRTLLSANTELTEDNIKIIKSWGVVEIDITDDASVSEPDKNIPEINPADRQDLERELSQRFRFLNCNHPLISELFTICLHREIVNRGLSDGE